MLSKKTEHNSLTPKQLCVYVCVCVCVCVGMGGGGGVVNLTSHLMVFPEQYLPKRG